MKEMDEEKIEKVKGDGERKVGWENNGVEGGNYGVEMIGREERTEKEKEKKKEREKEKAMGKEREKEKLEREKGMEIGKWEGRITGWRVVE